MLTRVLDGLFSGLGVLVAASPAITGVQAHLGDPQNIPAGVAYNYTGYDINAKSWNQSQAIAGISTVAVGGVIAGIPRIFRFVKRLVKGR